MRSSQIVLLASAAGLAVALASPAAARQCGSGQIFQVSKGRCISKAAASKAGIKVRHKQAAARLGKKSPAVEDADEADDTSPADRKAVERKDSRAGAADDRTQPERDAKMDEAAEPPVRTVTVRSDPSKAREAWNAAVAAAGKGGEPAVAPALSFAPQEGDVRRNVAPFGALDFGGLR